MKKDTIEDCKQWALNKQGKCLEATYINSYTKMLWECEKGHQWMACWNHIKSRGDWCRFCNSIDIKDCLEWASFKQGKCLETVYINNHTDMLWECQEGHRWSACWHSIKDQNTWCPSCAGKVKGTIIECQKYAKIKKGSLISTNYINCKLNMLWKCEKGHQWKASWDNIKNKDSWCPECSYFKTEITCKELLEQELGFQFKKTRFVYNNKRYEWDGYNEENKVAFEYQGIQHYVYPNHWHKTEEEYLKAKQRDIDKIIYAKENSIKLLIIPYTEENNLENYINNII